MSGFGIFLTIKERPLLAFSHHSLEHGYVAKILSSPSLLYFLFQVFFGYCNVVSLLGFIIHQSLEDTFVGALVVWLEE